MQSVAAQKSLLRKNILEQRKSFDENLTFESNEIICQNIIKLIKSIKTLGSSYCVGIYYPLLSEPNLLKTLFLIDQSFAMPIISGRDIELVKYYPGDALEQTSFKGLYQPVRKTEIIPDIIIVPGLAFDVGGYRLGFGKGHHDKYFKKVEPIKAPVYIGVCFHEDLRERLPFNADDHKMNFIVTDKIVVNL